MTAIFAGTLDLTVCRKLLDQLERWELFRQGGAVIYGRSGLGKTTAMDLLIKEKRRKYGEKYPIYIMTLSEQDATGKTEKYFYGRILDAMHHNSNDKNSRYTATMSRKRIINVMSADALETSQNVAIQIIDEAQYMTDERYSWLKGIYDELARAGEYGVRLITYLIGMEEMHKIRTRFIKSDETNFIANRFMISEFQFSGVKEMLSLEMILNDIENMEYAPDGNKIDIFPTLFPKAVKQGKNLTDLAELILNAFTEYNETKKKGRSFDEISMKNVMMCISMIFLDHSAYSKSGEKWPIPAAIRSIVRNTGFGDFG